MLQINEPQKHHDVKSQPPKVTCNMIPFILNALKRHIYLIESINYEQHLIKEELGSISGLDGCLKEY